MTAQVEHLSEWRTNVLEGWTDERIVSKRDLDALLWFYQHMYADLANFELTLRGWSYRESEYSSLLVLKVTQGDIPYVVFSGSRDAISCVRKLKLSFQEETFQLVRDKFA